MIRRIRIRRRVRRELREEAVVLERRLTHLRQRLGHAERRVLRELEGLTDAAPRCPKCGSTLTVRTAKKKSYNGASFWGCPRYLACGQGPIPLEKFPRAAYAIVTRTKKANG